MTEDGLEEVVEVVKIFLLLHQQVMLVWRGWHGGGGWRWIGLQRQSEKGRGGGERARKREEEGREREREEMSDALM